jgi:hypothetical protein
VIGANSRLERCDIRRGLIGDAVTLDGVHGRVTVGDHTEVHPAA